VSEDWAAVAAAITERVRELGWQQRQLAERSHVSQAIVRELQHHTVERRRSPRTLAALSTVLGWHPTYLAEVLHGRPGAATAGETLPMAASTPTVWSRLDDLDEHVRGIAARLDDLTIEVRAALRQLRSTR
jgi:transcriptional regulator with XRE-family HTH domain